MIHQYFQALFMKLHRHLIQAFIDVTRFSISYLRGYLTFLCLLFIFGTAQGTTGWYIVEKSEDRFGNFSYQSTFIQDGMMRIENERSIFILNLNSEEVTLIFPQTMAYWTGKHDSLQEAIISTIEMQLKISMAQLSDTERQSAEIEYDTLLRAMRSDTIIHHLPDQIKFRENNIEMNLLGFQAKGFEVLIDTTVYEKVWVTDQITPYSAHDIRQIAKLTKVFTRPSIVTYYRTSEEWYEMMQHGLIMKSVVPTAIGESVTIVDSMKEINIPSAFFDAPPDYRRIGIIELIQLTMGDDKPEEKPVIAPADRPENRNLYDMPEK
jgi:hypothetical protein